MAKMMVLGLKGEEGLWLVDFESGTVTPMDGRREDYLGHTENAAEEQSAEFGLAFEKSDEAFGGFMYRTPGIDISHSFENSEEAFAGFLYRAPDVTTSGQQSADVALVLEKSDEAFGGFMYRTPDIEVSHNVERSETAFSGQFYKTAESDGAGGHRAVN